MDDLQLPESLVARLEAVRRGSTRAFGELGESWALQEVFERVLTLGLAEAEERLARGAERVAALTAAPSGYRELPTLRPVEGEVDRMEGLGGE